MKSGPFAADNMADNERACQSSVEDRTISRYWKRSFGAVPSLPSISYNHLTLTVHG